MLPIGNTKPHGGGGGSPHAPFILQHKHDTILNTWDMYDRGTIDRNVATIDIAGCGDDRLHMAQVRLPPYKEVHKCGPGGERGGGGGGGTGKFQSYSGN